MIFFDQNLRHWLKRHSKEKQEDQVLIVLAKHLTILYSGWYRIFVMKNLYALQLFKHCVRNNPAEKEVFFVK